MTDEWRDLRVCATRTVADEVLEVTLTASDDLPLPPWTAGAHLEVEAGAGRIRQYSLCGPQDGETYRLAVLREADGRGGSVYVHTDAPVGSTLRVRGPRNHFTLGSHAHVILLAGGIGITPLKVMAEELVATGIPFELHYGGRTRSSMAFLDDLLALAPGAVIAYPQDEVGMPDLSQILASSPEGTAVYCCGPAGLLSAAAAAAAEHGLAEALHVERFSGTPAEPVPPDEDGTFVVELAESGGEVVVAPGQSILEAVRATGPDLMSSCEDGYCGTCETRVLDGLPLHRDTVLTPSEQDVNDTMMICVGRSRSPRLVLEL